MWAQMERRIWGLLVFPKLRSTNACSFLACPYGFDCHTLHDSFFQTKIPEDSRREISQCKSTTFEEREKCTEDVHRHRVNIPSMLAAQHHLLVPSLLCIRQRYDGVSRRPRFHSYFNSAKNFKLCYKPMHLLYFQWKLSPRSKKSH